MPPTATRSHWHHYLLRMAEKPLAAFAAGRLRAEMPVEAAPGLREPAAQSTHLEAVARTLVGIAPWLELEEPPADEVDSQTRLRRWAQAGLAQGLEPASPDALNFTEGRQPLVDAAFLAHACLRAPTALWSALDAITQDRLLRAWRATRAITPGQNNWLLFSAMVEAALDRFGGEGDLLRIDYAVRQHEQWYVGDGMYGDGAEFHWDYYNSFVIQPMLLDVLETVAPRYVHAAEVLPRVRQRAVRHATIQERLIAADGSFPPIGRSLAYRGGAFQLLAQMALREELPAGVGPAQVRGALTAVLRRTLDAPSTFDDAGWLRIGLAGHQPSLGERYISTGSLYLASTAFLPLGLSADTAFWRDPDETWTSVKLWRGEDAPADSALKIDG
jgi:hypothetical protein